MTTKINMTTSIRNQILITEAKRWIGSTEVGGNNRGEVVSIFQSLIGRAQGEAWCMSFVQFCLHWTDVYCNTILGEDFHHDLFKSEHCMTVWNKSPKECRLDEPEPGSVIIWNFHGTASGHTGIIVHVDGEILTTIEGNTSGRGSGVVREGDGVYIKKRPMKTIGRMKIVGYLNPWL